MSDRRKPRTYRASAWFRYPASGSWFKQERDIVVRPQQRSEFYGMLSHPDPSVPTKFVVIALGVPMTDGLSIAESTIEVVRRDG